LASKVKIRINRAFEKRGLLNCNSSDEEVVDHSNEELQMHLLMSESVYSNGTTHLEFTPEQFIKRLIALIPPPRKNFIRYYGVFGSRHRNRNEITAKAKVKKEKPNKKIEYRTPWAELLKRVFKYEVSYCDHCGTKLRLVATITSHAVYPSYT